MLTADEWLWVLRGLSAAAWLLLVWMLWRRDRRDRQVDQHEADIADLWAAVFGSPPDPEPATAPIRLPGPSTDTAEAHPADTFARQQHVLATPERGRHRRKDPA